MKINELVLGSALFSTKNFGVKSWSSFYLCLPGFLTFFQIMKQSFELFYPSLGEFTFFDGEVMASRFPNHVISCSKTLLLQNARRYTQTSTVASMKVPKNDWKQYRTCIGGYMESLN